MRTKFLLALGLLLFIQGTVSAQKTNDEKPKSYGDFYLEFIAIDDADFPQYNNGLTPSNAATYQQQVAAWINANPVKYYQILESHTSYPSTNSDQLIQLEDQSKQGKFKDNITLFQDVIMLHRKISSQYSFMQELAKSKTGNTAVPVKVYIVPIRKSDYDLYFNLQNL